MDKKRRYDKNKEKEDKKKFIEIHSQDPNRFLNLKEISVMLGVSESTAKKKLINHPAFFKIMDSRWGMQYKDVVKVIEEDKKRYQLPADMPEEQNKAG